MANASDLRELQSRLADRLQAARTEPRRGSPGWRSSAPAASCSPGARPARSSPMAPMVPVPHSHRWFLGVANLRGHLYGVVDLAGFLGQPRPSRRPRPRRRRGWSASTSRSTSTACCWFDRLSGLRSEDELTASSDAAGGAPGLASARATPMPRRVWQEIDLRELAQRRSFLSVGDLEASAQASDGWPTSRRDDPIWQEEHGIADIQRPLERCGRGQIAVRRRPRDADDAGQDERRRARRRPRWPHRSIMDPMRMPPSPDDETAAGRRMPLIGAAPIARQHQDPGIAAGAARSVIAGALMAVPRRVGPAAGRPQVGRPPAIADAVAAARRVGVAGADRQRAALPRGEGQRRGAGRRTCAAKSGDVKAWRRRRRRRACQNSLDGRRGRWRPRREERRDRARQQKTLTDVGQRCAPSTASRPTCSRSPRRCRRSSCSRRQPGPRLGAGQLVMLTQRIGKSPTNS